MIDRSSPSSLRPPSLLERIGGFLFRWRNLIFPVILLGLLGGLRPVPLFGQPRADRWMDAVGIAIALAGQGLRVAVIGLAYIVRGGKEGKVYAARLVTEGLFSHARNPLYLGNLMVLTGLFAIHNHPWVYAVGLPAFLFAYAAIVAAEEAYLTRHFGDEYQEYCHRVPRWVPSFRGLRRTVAEMEFKWRRVVLKEYGSTYAWIAGVLMLLAYEAVVESSFHEQRTYLITLAALLALLTAAWAGVRRWKKSQGSQHRTAAQGTSK